MSDERKILWIVVGIPIILANLVIMWWAKEIYFMVKWKDKIDKRQEKARKKLIKDIDDGSKR